MDEAWRLVFHGLRQAFVPEQTPVGKTLETHHQIEKTQKGTE